MKPAEHIKKETAAFFPTQAGGIASKIILYTSLMFVAVVIVVMAISYKMYKDAFYEYGNALCINSNAAVAHAIDGDLVRRFAATLKVDEDYEKFAAGLDELSKKINARYLYILVDRGVPGMYTYIYDATHSQEFPGEKYALGRNESDIDYAGADTVLATGRGFEKAAYYNDHYGELYYAYAPIFDSSGAVVAFVGTDVDITPLHAQVDRYFWNIFWTMATALVVFAAVYYLLIKSVLTKPLIQISRRALSLARGDLNLEISEKILARRDEIGGLARVFDSMAHSIAGVVLDIEGLMKAVREGRLNERADNSAYQGDYRRIISGLNSTLKTTSLHFDALPEAIAFFDADRRLLYRNQGMNAFINLYGLAADGPAILERLFAPANGSPPADPAPLFEGQALQPLVMVVSIRTPGQGEERHYSVTLLRADALGRAVDVDGHICLMLVVSDMTALVRARNGAEAASRAKSQFLSRMSHEIRTPMNAIIGMTQLAIGSRDFAKIDESLRQIDESSQHLLGVINDILDFSKIEAGKMTLESREFSLSENTAFVVSMMQSKASERGISIESKSDGLIHDRVTADSLRLNQVLINILSNAIKFSNQGGRIDLNLSEMSHDQGQSRFRFSIQDYGIGIDPRQQGRLFQPFEQANESVSRSYGGTGLGLVIAKSIVETMGGELSLESEPGRGTRFFFTVSLPAAASPAEEKAAAAPPKKPAVRRDFTGKRALVVDDIDLNRKIAIQLLARFGLECEDAVDGREAVDIFEHSPVGYFDFVLMDMLMPVMDGCEASLAIRALPRPDAATVRIVAMTANVMQEDVEKALAAGMNAHAGKPVNMRELLEALDPAPADTEVKK
ncbi:MAG: response regulator [Candidatus Adiutrix sp.]|jgi:signal transduction histidine kinase|nr:response regulator [Candidatus Adiutrix sp.]